MSERKSCSCLCSDLLVLGPKRLHTLLGYVARAKAEFEEATRSFKSQLGAELDAEHHGRQNRYLA